MPEIVSNKKDKKKSRHKPYHMYYPQPDEPVYTEYPIYSHPYISKLPKQKKISIKKEPPKKLKSVKGVEEGKPKKMRYKSKQNIQTDYDFETIQSHRMAPPPVSPAIPPYISPSPIGPMQMQPYPFQPPPQAPVPPQMQTPQYLPQPQQPLQTQPPPIPPPQPQQLPPPWTMPPFPTYPTYWPNMLPYAQPKIFKRVSEIPLFLIFLVCITVYWLPYIISSLIGVPFFLINEDLAEVGAGIVLCILTIALMLGLRSRLDKPTLKEYGFSFDNLGSNLILTVKLIFIIYAVEWIVVFIFQSLGVSFEGGPGEVNIYFIISAVIIAPIFEETVYRANASTLLARKLPIIWVAIITSTWFIAKHLPMWYFDNNFGLPALGVILLVDIPLWIVITYYYLKRRCIWIPFFIHMFNNGSIALFYYMPDFWDSIFDYSFLIIGGIFILIFGLPWFYHKIYLKYVKGKFQITQQTLYYFIVSLGLTILLLITTEALVSIRHYDEFVCIPLGFGLIIISIITVVYILSTRDIEYTEEQISYLDSVLIK